MKTIRALGAAAVVVLCGAIVPLYAQHDGGEKQEQKQARPQTQQESKQPARETQKTQPTRPQEQARQPKMQSRPQAEPVRQQAQRVQQQSPPPRQQPQHAVQQPQRSQQQARSWQQQKGWTKQGGGSQGHATFAQDRSSNWSSDHRTWAQRGGYGGYQIPQDRFAVSFGSQHFFRLGGMPIMYEGYPQFTYGGFSFLMVDPWPGDWPGNWYSSDDVYVDYDNGYYLYNRSFPQERLAITIRL